VRIFIYAWLAATLLSGIPSTLNSFFTGLLGERVARRVPVRLVHLVAAAIFAAMGVIALLGG
jgi:putative Ca2+/H+ antiporter (TMEM165/GDT1 family)